MVLTPPELVKRALANRRSERVPESGLIPASVLVLLYPKDGDYCVLLNKRSEEVEHHKGEISFPGGARDPEDADSLDTALRETQEEMGILRDDVTILGEMDEVATRSLFRVNVFAGAIEHSYRFQPSVDEIAEVVEFPVKALRDPASRRWETRWQDGAAVTTYSYAFGNHLVFGATARILQQFLELLNDGELLENGLESEGQRIE
jgi:8-oxo-dGTP pyrophosphatase MutT (NUDIX family)